MKILHVVPGLNEPTNGIARAAKRIAAEQVALGHEVVCVETREFVSSSPANLNLSSYDVAFVHSMWLPMTIRAAGMVKAAGVKLVRMPHGCLDPKKVRGGWWKKLPVLLTLERQALKAADLTYVTCDAEAKWMRPWVGKIVNVPLGVDFNAGDFVARKVGQDLNAYAPSAAQPDGMSTSCPVVPHLKILFIGRMHPLKGLDVLLEAVANRENVELTVVGLDEKGMRARFEAWCAAKGIASRVRFLGVVDEATKIAEIDRCDLFCLPTLSENFGIVVGEAMSRGKPVITTDGATSWSQLPADCGWYLDGYLKANHKRRVAMLTAALDEASGKNLAAMGSESSKWVRANFDWTTNVRRLMEAIDWVTGSVI